MGCCPWSDTSINAFYIIYLSDPKYIFCLDSVIVMNRLQSGVDGSNCGLNGGYEKLRQPELTKNNG